MGHPLPVNFNVLPYGLYMTSFFGFPKPSTTDVLPKWDINLFFDSIPQYHITILGLVPSLVHQLSVVLRTSRPSSLPSYARFPDVAGINEDAFPTPSYAWVIVLLSTCTGYGLSEFTAVAIPGMLDGWAKNKPGSVGILVSGVEARILCPDGSLAGSNEASELLVRGGTAVLGYKGNAKATRETFIDGWLRTGDRMRIDEDGVLFFEDRTKDTLKISGMQVSPVEIEILLLAQPDKLIIDVRVAGVSGGRTSDERVPRAWIVPSLAGAALGEKEFVTWLDA